MAVPRDRIIASFFAIIFIISTLALSFTVVYSVLQSNKANDNGATSTPADGTNPQENAVSPENQLQGKPLAGFTPVENIEQLQKVELAPGTGDTVSAEDTITVDYTGALASTGVVFESSLDTGQPATFPLNAVIQGWTQGLPGAKVGSTVRLLIPSDLAYKDQPKGNIPPNSDLVFDIVIKEIVKQ